MARVHIKTFGCQMNEYDSGKMLEVLAAAEGYSLTEDPAEADLLLLNTCSVREKAQERPGLLHPELEHLHAQRAARPQLRVGQRDQYPGQPEHQRRQVPDQQRGHQHEPPPSGTRIRPRQRCSSLPRKAQARQRHPSCRRSPSYREWA